MITVFIINAPPRLPPFQVSIGGKNYAFDPDEIEKNPMRAPDAQAAAEMVRRVIALAEDGNSAGGVVECRIEGVKPGIGDPVFEKLDAELREMRESEMWQAGAAVRSLRPENWSE